MKSDLAGATMQSGTSVANLSHSDLKELFTLDVETACSTQRLLESCQAGASTAVCHLICTPARQLQALHQLVTLNIIGIDIISSGTPSVHRHALQAVDAVTWLTLPNQSSADDGSINGLPPVLRAAIRTKAVTAISKESAADQVAQGLLLASSAKEAACDHEQQDKKRCKSTDSSEFMDVSCLEIDMAP